MNVWKKSKGNRIPAKSRSIVITIIIVRFLIILISSVHLYYSTSVEQNSLFFNTAIFII